MSKHTETELKLRCTDESVWEKIMTAEALTNLAVPGTAKTEQLEARYFDTTNHSLQNAKLAYRVRREGEVWVATVKSGGSSKGGLHARQEWNIAVGSEEPDITVFLNTEVGSRLQEVIGDQILEPILITRFERQILEVIMHDGATIEVAADKGEIIAGEKTAPILEVELELKSGQPRDLFLLGAALAKEYPLLPEPDSKYYRGLLLAGLSTEIPRRNELPQVDKSRPVGEVLRVVLVDLIAQVLLAQRSFLEHKEQPGLVHELRICLRRLRSVLEFSEPLTVIKEYSHYQDELRMFGRKVEALRELDVAYCSWHHFLDYQMVSMDGKIWLGEVLTEKRSQEAEKIYAEYNSGLTTSTLLGLWAELLDEDCQHIIPHDCTVDDYVITGLLNWLRIVGKQEKSVEWTDAENVHKIRLWVKKIRYTMEVLQPDLKGTPRLLLKLEKLQDTLGIISDAKSTEGLLRELLRGKSSKGLPLEAGMLIGWQCHETLNLRKKLDKYWLKFNRTVQKWK